MKKSNKLLLGGFLTGLLMITALHITLYAKYKAGNYSAYHAEDDVAPQSMQTFPNILFVSLRNIPDATVRFSDVTQVPKGEEERIEYVQKGDTLLITGRDEDNERGMYYPVAFNLPYNATISVFNSSLSIESGKKLTVNNP